jgi:membrane protein DedA with SNARE-associated domain
MTTSLPIWHLILEYRYWIVLPLACLEGPLVAFVVGALAARDLFDIESAFVLLMLGDILPDLTCFLIGRRAAGSDSVGRWLQRHRVGRSTQVVNAFWRDHGLKTMVISKLSYGLSTPLLMTAGMAGLPIWKFAGYALPVSLLQYAAFLTLGYYLGSHFGAIASISQYAQLIAAAVVLLGMMHVLVGSWLNRRLGSTSERKP